MQDYVSLDWQKTLNHLIQFATSTQGKESLRQTKPWNSSRDAEESFNRITEAQRILQTGQRPFMEGLDLYSTWIHRLEKNAQLKTIELKDVRLFLLETESLREVLKPLEGPWIEQISQALMEAKEPLSSIDHLMTPSGDIRTDASENLYKLHNEKRQLAQKVQLSLDQVVKGFEHEHDLQDKYVTNREGRWVIPIKSGMRHNIEGIIHAASASKQTVFMEPQVIVPLNNRIKQLEIEIEKEIQKLLREVSDYLYQKIAGFQRTKEWLFLTDIHLAKAQFANVTRGNSVTFASGSVSLVDLKHPLMVLNGENVISNNLILNQKQRVLLLSGPNAGGKTVLLKAFGLAAHMARCGLPICASSESSIPFFEDIFAAVGDSQSVDDSLSTFAGHLNILDQSCHTASEDALILVDEICGSTDPDEGAALARSFINHYASQNAFALITSHLGPLKIGWAPDSGVLSGSMNYDNKSGRATYEFVRGVPGQSLAFATAKKIGILESVYKRAQSYLSPEGKKRLQSMDEVERLKDEISDLRLELRKNIQQSKAKQKELDSEVRKFQIEKDKLLQQEVQKSMHLFNEDLKKNKVRNIFSSHEIRSKMDKSFPKIVKYSDQPSEKIYSNLEAFTKGFPPGSLVFVTSLNQDGIVQGRPNAKDEIPILSGSMRLMVHWEALTPPKKASNPLKKRSTSSNNVQAEYTETKSELDVRGCTSEEALEKLELAIDRANVGGNERLKIIHGHGTDTLKKTVRNHLSRSVRVSRWQVAMGNEGGDGVTWAFLMTDQ